MISIAVAQPVFAASLFGTPVAYQVDGSPLRVVAGDIDAKNGVDLITGNDTGENGPSLSILLNKGQGAFQPEVRKNLDASQDLLQAVAAGDFNRDGATDIAVATDDLTVFPTQTVVSVYRNNGAGQLSSPDRYPLHGFFPQCLEAADVTNDGVLDLVVCHSTSDSGEGVLSVLAGRSTGGVPNGGFDSGVDFKVGTTPATVAVGDVDGDAHNDLAVGDSARRTVFVLYGTGTVALLAAPVGLVDVDAPSAVRVRVAPGGSLPEILVSSLVSNQVLILRQTAPRVFATPVPLVVGDPSSDMGVADFDGDGITDLALLSPLSGKLNIWYGAADNSFSFAEAVPVDAAANSLAVADLNRDSKPDVATTSFVTTKVSVSLNAGVRPTVTPTGRGSSTPSPSPTVTLTPTRVVSATPTRTPTATPSPHNTPTTTRTPAGPGDANCDGHIDAGDVDGVIARLFGPGCSGADVDGDGTVTVADLVLLIQAVSDSVQ